MNDLRDDDHVHPTTSRRQESKPRSRRKAVATIAVATGAAAVLIVIAVAITSPAANPVIPSAPTATPLPREQMALTPPMGWNSWNQVGCAGLTAQVVESAADAIAADGLRATGYQYVVIDDCWQGGRDAHGALIPDSQRFPDGMKAVADYVHADGLKFGIYAVPGGQTCGNYFDRYPVQGIGSLGHEKQDADTFARWGVDYLKYDWCRADITNHLTEQAAFTKMEHALQATGRSIVLSISEYGVQKPWLWAPGIANLWRTTHDLHPLWSSVLQHINAQAPITTYARPGAWNDPDMLEIGNGGLTPSEDTSHFAMWCMLAAPLFLGTDISQLPAASIRLVTNPELVAIDQDPLGHEARQISSAEGIQLWVRPLQSGSYAVALLNTNPSARTMSASLALLGIPTGTYTVRDVVERVSGASTSSGVQGTAPAHGIVVLELTPKN